MFPLHFVSVFDLINPGGQRVPLPVREVAKTGLFRIAQLTETQVRSLFPYYSFVTTFFSIAFKIMMYGILLFYCQKQSIDIMIFSNSKILIKKLTNMVEIIPSGLNSPFLRYLLYHQVVSVEEALEVLQKGCLNR